MSNDYSKKYNMSYKLMMRLVRMVEQKRITKDNPLIGGKKQYEGMKRELEQTKDK